MNTAGHSARDLGERCCTLLDSLCAEMQGTREALTSFDVAELEFRLSRQEELCHAATLVIAQFLETGCELSRERRKQVVRLASCMANLNRVQAAVLQGAVRAVRINANLARMASPTPQEYKV